MLTTAPPLEQPLAQWLRLLWDAAPPLHLHSGDDAGPFIADGGIHLPAQPMWQKHCAAAAHAAAHLVYSPRRFDADGLVPTARALLALLEDARVETLATRELPGLARLWRPLHAATSDSGQGSEALMARLARALADPGYHDPHPWVTKGRRLFYLDEGLGLPALRTTAELRGAAIRLGHDLGQMRLPFSPRDYRPAPAYRDDHRWMWPTEQLAPVQPPRSASPAPADAQQQPDAAEVALPEAISHHPEWDRLIRRLRPDWTRAIGRAAAPGNEAHASGDASTPQPGRRLLAPLPGMARPLAWRRRAAEGGEAFDLDALLGRAIARRCGHHGDAGVFQARQHQAAQAGVWLLVDQSASTAEPPAAPQLVGVAAAGAAGPSVLKAAGRSAASIALALQALGVACVVAAFQSNGRHAVRLTMLQPLDSRGDRALASLLHTLRPGRSTRLGAALRLASQRLGRAAGTGRADASWVLLVSDGQPHDVDVHDPRYLVDDARQAVRAARRRGVRMTGLTLTARPASDALRIFGRAGTQTVGDLGGLPRALRRLLG